MKFKVLIREISNLMAWRKLPVKTGDLVLDVGSGDNPHVRADVLCDASLSDSDERSGKFDLIIDGRPFVFADACKLPFQNKAFDFVLCRHLLEHINNPTELLDELVRVGKAGYIETPSSLMEKLYGWDFHCQLIDCQNDILIIRPKTQDERYGILPVEIKKDPNWEKMIKKKNHVFSVSYFWINRIQYRTEGIFSEVLEKKSEIITSIPKRSLGRNLRWWITNAVRFFVARPQFKIAQILACPDCHVELKFGATQVICPKCKKYYSVISDNCYKFI